ncbi:MAG: Mov34/MPN/PAD-1 family protein [Sedimenticola sp.]|nr:Mov34/MPN/PAD-1 family protein [Sedimenticola sp.]
MSQLFLSQHLRDQLALLASLGYPNETCGVLLGKQVQGHVSVHRIEETPYPNLDQTEGHFNLDPLDLQNATHKAEKRGLEIVGIWRALPDKPYTPTHDERELAWPNYSYLLVSITPKGISTLRSWRLSSNLLLEEELML